MVAEEIDLRHYLEILWKWKWIIVLLTGICVLTSAVFSFFVLAPVYETKVTLMVYSAATSQQSAGQQGDGTLVDTVSKLPTLTLNTYMSQITNSFFLNRVIDELGLDITPTALTSMVSSQIIKDTNLIEIRVENTDKILATEIANCIAYEFVQFVSETNQEQMGKSLAFLSEQKEALQVELDQVYMELKSIQSRPDNTLSLAREISVKSQGLVKFHDDLVRAQMERDLLQAGLAQIEVELAQTPEMIETGTTPEGEPVLSHNPIYQSLLQSKATKSIQLAEITSHINGLTAELNSLDRSLASMETRLTVVQQEESEARTKLKRLEDRMVLLDAKMVDAQMAQSINFGETNISVVSPALQPNSPIKPRKVLNMAIAGVLGGFISVLLAFVLEYLDNTIKSQDDVTKHLNLGTLGVIPYIQEKDQE